MNGILPTLILSVLLFTGYPQIVGAVSVSPIPEQREEKAAKGIREKGEKVCLFQSGTGDVKRTIVVGDILKVYREDDNRLLKMVGRIKVLSYIGDDYLSGEVVEGVVRTDDIAKKGDVASLVISSGDKCGEKY